MNVIRVKILAFATLVLTAGLSAFAQQDPQFTHNMFNQMAVNPGFAGSQGMLSAGMINRQQWMGFEGNPKTTLFSVHTPVKPFDIPSGAGLVFVDDRLGFEKNMSFYGNYAYRLDLGKGKLGIGLNVGLLSRALNGKWFIPDSDNHTPATQDPSIPDEQVTSMTFDMGLGVFYNTDAFYAGLSTTHLLEPNVDFGSGAMMKMRRHYYGTAGYLFKLANPVFEIQPSCSQNQTGPRSSSTLMCLYYTINGFGEAFLTGSAMPWLLWSVLNSQTASVPGYPMTLPPPPLARTATDPWSSCSVTTWRSEQTSTPNVTKVLDFYN